MGRRLRHASDRLAKTENVMEKYKKKLQEGADLRQHVKVHLSPRRGCLVLLNSAVTGKTKCRSGGQERILGGRVPQSGRV
jgi:hypothetical protein